MPNIFQKTRVLTAQIDDFLDALSEGVLVFQEAIADYVAGDDERFRERMAAVNSFENRCDSLRRAIERHLYSESLIPESRGDVLGLLETLDDVIDAAKTCLNTIDIERPEILPDNREEWVELAHIAGRTAESVVLAARSFFRDPKTVSDHLHKVFHFEKEGDKALEHLRRKIFAADIDLARKAHLRDCATTIDMLSDTAEGVADRLSIYAIKRMV